MKELEKSVANIKVYLGVLDNREKQIIQMRLGLQDGDKKTLQDIGNLFGLSKERIRQIERRALNKIKEAELVITRN